MASPLPIAPKARHEAAAKVAMRHFLTRARSTLRVSNLDVSIRFLEDDTCVVSTRDVLGSGYDFIADVNLTTVTAIA